MPLQNPGHARARTWRADVPAWTVGYDRRCWRIGSVERRQEQLGVIVHAVGRIDQTGARRCVDGGTEGGAGVAADHGTCRTGGTGGTKRCTRGGVCPLPLQTLHLIEEPCDIHVLFPLRQMIGGDVA